MTYENARQLVMLAGRELGSGPMVAVERLVPGIAEAEFNRRVEYEERVRADWERRRDEGRESADEVLAQLGEINRENIRMITGNYAFGIAIGLVMAESLNAMTELAKITDEWRNNSSR